MMKGELTMGLYRTAPGFAPHSYRFMVFLLGTLLTFGLLTQLGSSWQSAYAAVCASTATGTADPPAQCLIEVSGDDQITATDHTLKDPLIVQVQNSNEETVEGVEVTFEITAGP